MSSFKETVQQFYAWFNQEEAVLRQLIQEGNLEEGYQRFQSQLNLVFPSLPFQLYRHQSGKIILELTMTMDATKKILGFAFCDELDEKYSHDWMFVYAHPNFKGTLNHQGIIFEGSDFIIYPSVNKQRRKIDIKIKFNEKFKALKEKERFLLCYMMLMDYLGEMCTEAMIQNISFMTKIDEMKMKKNECFLLKDFDSYVRRICKDNTWQNPNEIKLISESFDTRKNKSNKLRHDIIQGTSYCLDLLNEEENARQPLLNYIHECQVQLYSLVIDHAQMHDDETITSLNQRLLDKLNAILVKQKVGMVIASASGNCFEYLDFFLFEEKKIEDIKPECLAIAPHCLKMIQIKEGGIEQC